MINEWKKVVNAIMIFECSTGELALCLCLLGFVGQTSFSFSTETLIQIIKLCIGICTYIPRKSKTNIASLLKGFTKSPDSDLRRIDKGRMYLNTYCRITITTIKSNLNKTARYIMKHRLRSDLWILTESFENTIQRLLMNQELRKYVMVDN